MCLIVWWGCYSVTEPARAAIPGLAATSPFTFGLFTGSGLVPITRRCHMDRWLTRRRMGALAGAFGAAIVVTVQAPASVASAGGSPSAALVAAEAAPAVQLVVISYNATVLVPKQKNNL